MATITTIQATDTLANSRAPINSNFATLNSAKVEGAIALVSAGKLVKVTSAGIVGESIASESGGTLYVSGDLKLNGGASAVNLNARADANSGAVNLQAGTTSFSGYVEWWIPGPVRLAHMGYSDASAMRLALENVAKFEITGAPVEIKSYTGVDALKVFGGSPTKCLVVKPEITAGLCDLGYWNGTDWEHLFLERVTISSHGLRFNDLTVQTTAMTTGHRYRTLGLTIDGAGSPITTGSKGYITVPYDCTIDLWTVLGDQAGSVTVDVKRATYAAFPTTTSIVGAGGKPTLSSARKAQSAPTGWTSIALAAGDVIEFTIDSAATITRLSVSLRALI